jgi:cyd operon protein YbgT
MWYFSWILGVGVALAAGVIGALWVEAREERQAGSGPGHARKALPGGTQGAA